MDGKGDGPYTHGNSFANGPLLFFRGNWEYKDLVIPSRVTLYDFP